MHSIFLRRREYLVLTCMLRESDREEVAFVWSFEGKVGF